MRPTLEDDESVSEGESRRNVDSQTDDLDIELGCTAVSEDPDEMTSEVEGRGGGLSLRTTSMDDSNPRSGWLRTPVVDGEDAMTVGDEE